MWQAIVLVPTPVPSPVYVVLDSGAHGWWQTWGPTVSAILVAVLALGGVIWSSIFSAGQNRKAENKRAQDAIDAENLRHQNALDADEARHQQAIALERDHRLAAARGELYERIERTRKPIADLCGALRYVVNLNNGEPLREALVEFEATRAETYLHASLAVRAKSTGVYVSAASLIAALQDFHEDESSAARTHIRECVSDLDEACRDLLRSMRVELGAADD